LPLSGRSLPLSARARIEVFLPDLLSLPSQELLIVFNQEFTYTFGGATLWRGLDGSYLAQDGRTVRDRINLLYTDTPFSLEENAKQVSSYMAKSRQAVLDALQEEAVLVVAVPIYHVEQAEVAGRRT
jgi:hypothetical protein